MEKVLFFGVVVDVPVGIVGVAIDSPVSYYAKSSSFQAKIPFTFDLKKACSFYEGGKVFLLD